MRKVVPVEIRGNHEDYWNVRFVQVKIHFLPVVHHLLTVLLIIAEKRWNRRKQSAGTFNLSHWQSIHQLTSMTNAKHGVNSNEIHREWTFLKLNGTHTRKSGRDIRVQENNICPIVKSEKVEGRKVRETNKTETKKNLPVVSWETNFRAVSEISPNLFAPSFLTKCSLARITFHALLLYWSVIWLHVYKLDFFYNVIWITKYLERVSGLF